jgi:flagellar biosynthesis GTPase FlhF
MQVEETSQSPLRPTRAGFVRGLPLSMPVEEVIERGREAGIQLQPSDIHAARYYMRQGGEAPQQLTLRGTLSRKSNNGAGGQAHGGDANNAKSDSVLSANASDRVNGSKLIDPDDDDFEDSEAPAAVAPRRRKIVHSKATIEAAQAKEQTGQAVAKATAPNAKDSNGAALHDRLQARLANVTFRETARENAREERKAERLAAREERQAERDAEREERKAEREAARAQRQNARQTELQNARQSVQAKQDRQARRERLEKATIGKALLNADSIKSRKRAAQATEVLEEQLRLIALRLGSQRVRELLDAMETLAARKA